MTETPIRDVVVLVGSLRREGYSAWVARALAGLAPPGMVLRVVPIGGLPIYDADEDAAPPAPWTGFRDAVRGATAVLFVTPEYNRSVPGGLKNAIDIGSRPYGKSVFAGKPAAVVSQSPGAMGGFGANHAIRQSLVFLDMPVLQQPEAYLSHVGGLFDAEGKLVNEGTAKFLGMFLERFAGWIDRTAAR
jgi:chromate reductase